MSTFIKKAVKKLNKKFLPYILTPFVCEIESPVFIIGSAKSGTTIIAYLLGKASGKQVTLDIVRAIKGSDLQLKLKYGLISFEDMLNKYRYEFSKPLIKEPFLTFFIDDLIEFFPKAKFVYIVRNPFDNIRSVLNRLKIPGNLTSIKFDDWEELCKTPGWRLALSSTWLGDPSDSYIEGMAKTWNIASRGYFEHTNKLFLFRYEDFLSDKSGTINMLLNSLDIDVVQNISSIVDIQQQPKGDRKVNLKDFFGEKNFQIIHSICGNTAKNFGYDSVE